MSPLASFTNEQFAEELLRRGDLFESPGVLPFELHKLRVEMGPIPCVDGAALRKGENGYEALAVRRGTGLYKGKLCLVGGGVRLGESIDEALRRHFQTDLGAELVFLSPLEEPAAFFQYYSPNKDMVPKKGFLPEPSKHSFAPVYAVKLLGDPTNFGATLHGGQEVIGFEWITLDAFPESSEFAYEQDRAFRTVLQKADRLFTNL